jgi:hypothetical protein
VKRTLFALGTLAVIGCVDSGPVPFSTGKLFTGGKGGFQAGGSGGGGGSYGGAGGYGGSGGQGGSYGGAGGYGGSGGGSCSNVGQSCSASSQCCQTDYNGDTCVGDPIYQCAAICYSSSECAANCCVQLTGVPYGACLVNSTYPCMP